MTGIQRLEALRKLVLTPFAAYGELNEREHKVATLYVRGHNMQQIAQHLNVSRKTAYRALETAAAKVGKQDGVEVYHPELQKYIWKKLRELAD